MNHRVSSCFRLMFYLILAVALFVPHTTQGKLMVTSAEARAFLGGRTGKLVYLKNNSRQMYFLDFSDSVLVEKQLSLKVGCRNPMIGPNGNKVVYEWAQTMYLTDFVENSTAPSIVHSTIYHKGMTMEPKWWTHASTGDEYIIFSTGNISEFKFPQTSSATYMQKIINLQTSGSPVTLMPFLMAGGRSKNGKWGATAHHAVGMFSFYPDMIEQAYYGSTNWGMDTTFGACNPSISPSNDPSRQSRMMHLHSGVPGVLNGSHYANHQAVVIRDWLDSSAWQPLWVMGLPGTGCNNDSSNNLYWSYPEWSTDEDYFTVTGSKVIINWDEADLYIVRINLEGESRLLKILEGDGVYYYPHLWVKEGQLPAHIQMNVHSLDFTSFIKNTLGPPPQVISITNTGDVPLPQLVLSVLPSWLSIEIQNNGTDSARLINTINRDTVAPGLYDTVVTVSFGQFTDSAQYYVSFKYMDPVLTSLRPSRFTAVLLPGDSLKLKATGLDQKEQILTDQPSVTWSAIDAGINITDSGLVTAPAEAGSVYRVRGVSGSIACTTRVVVTGYYLKLNVGSDIVFSVPGWESDTTVLLQNSSSAQHLDNSPDSALGTSLFNRLQSVMDPAPDTAYLTCRLPGTRYLIPNLPKRKYQVIPHFTSLGRPTSVAPGAVSFSIQGTKLLNNFILPPDSVSPAVHIQAFTAHVTDTSGLFLEFQGGTALPTTVLNALEIYDIGTPPLVVTYPNGGEVLTQGDTISINWDTDSNLIRSCGIQISVDSGSAWHQLNLNGSVGYNSDEWGNFSWIVPDSLEGVSTLSSRVIMSVYDYFGSATDYSDATFTIDERPNMVPRLTAGDWCNVHHWGNYNLTVKIKDSGNNTESTYALNLKDIRGTVIHTQVLGPGTHSLHLPAFTAGIYWLTLKNKNAQYSKKLLFL